MIDIDIISKMETYTVEEIRNAFKPYNDNTPIEFIMHDMLNELKYRRNRLEISERNAKGHTTESGYSFIGGGTSSRAYQTHVGYWTLQAKYVSVGTDLGEALIQTRIDIPLRKNFGCWPEDLHKWKRV